jgi:hypothetical protein
MAADFNEDDFIKEAQGGYGGGGGAAPTSSGSDSGFDEKQFLSEVPQSSGGTAPEAPKGGSSPATALPSSPLSVIERAALGWLRDPNEQYKYLAGKFGGPKNVQRIKVDDDKENYVVMDGRDGHWKQIDPAGISDIPSELLKGHFSKAKDLAANFDLSNAAGGLAQGLAERPGAMIGAGLVGGAALASLGPAAGIGAAGLALGVGGAAGGAAGEVGEQAVRSALPQGMGGLSPDQTYADYKQQIIASMLLGAGQELMGGAANAVLKGGAKAFGSVLKTIAGADNPGAKDALAKVISVGSDLEYPLARAYADDPVETARFQQSFLDSRKANNGSFYNQKVSHVLDWIDDVNDARMAAGKQFDVIADKANKIRFDPFKPNAEGVSPVGEVIEGLQKDGILNEKALLRTAEDLNDGRVSASISKRDADAVRNLQTNIRQIGEDYRRNGNTTYENLKRLKENLGDAVYGDDGVTSSALKRRLTIFRDKIDSVIGDGLQAKDEALFKRWTEANSNYNTLYKTYGDFAKLEDGGAKVDTFIRKLTTKGEASSIGQVMSLLQKRFGVDNPGAKLMRMEAAERTAGGFFGPKFPTLPITAHGIPVPVPILSAVNNVSQVTRAASDATAKALPFLKRAHDIFSGMPEGYKSALLRSSDAVSGLIDMTQGAVKAADQNHQALLQSALSQAGGVANQSPNTEEVVNQYR